ncbi:hypothetical protein [Aeromicrobium erythreum]|uniref:Uncharacterized protein n=1 Tax=Aeromicrobium erythreum TaxID=2041 RepID=A0A0U4CFT4_9ACTN|nr:hypothetical protein [Aeromicrobium erythreum]ALX04293.1 hypothetical protein AERYTH_06065 [Aeromicrobium erythreum]
MDAQMDASTRLEAANSMTARAQLRHGLPRWYATWSTAAFACGAGLSLAGAVTGWFVPLLGFVVLSLNVLTFLALFAVWRAQGVVPREGRRTRTRYWIAAPPLIVLAAGLGMFALTIGDGVNGWVTAAVVVPFAIEHALRLKSWTRR